MKKLIALSLATLIVSGCASPKNTVAIMYNQETKDTQKCTVDAEIYAPWNFEKALNQCVKGYEAAGYKRVDEH